MLPGAKNGVTGTAANTGDCHIPLRNYRRPRALCLYTRWVLFGTSHAVSVCLWVGSATAKDSVGKNNWLT
ncbi:Uncharacterized protein APZ42_014748 [Daphnia magna]|uniref:Uncharacterized protein n=1 Tax=Daphnia magna TaxID=35525 RepID=A0A162PM08_9CRUS|nr:Uncharacterized protein APZ42_014748 [Daphnia magna]